MKSPGSFAVVVLAGLVAAFWLSVGVSSLLFGDGWISLSLADAIGSLVRLAVGAADHPRQAIPKPERAAMPTDPAAFYGTGVALLALVGILLGSLSKLLTGIAPVGRDRSVDGGRPPAARWASWWDLRRLRVRAPVTGRVTIGDQGGSLIAAENGRSLLVVAPTQTGKTSSLAVPAILEWEGPVVATSVKSDLVRDTLARRQLMGDAMVFDPTAATSLPAVRATPLAGCGSWERTLSIAHSLVSAAKPERPGLEGSEFWYGLAEKLIAPLMRAARASGKDMGSVMRWLDNADLTEHEVEDLLAEADEPGALQAFRAVRDFEDRQRSSVYATAQQVLFAYSDPRVLDSATGSDYTPARLLDGGSNTLYLCSPAHEQERLRPIFATLVRELVGVAYEAATATGRPLDPPLLLVLDELANIAPIANLDEVASTGAGQGIQLVSIVQDLSQLRSRYGNRAQSIANNHTAKLFGPGLSDPETLGYVSRVLGPGRFQQSSESSGEPGRHSRTESTTYRDLVPPGLVREADWGSALLIYGNLPPARIGLRFWPETKRLRRLVDEANAARASAEEVVPVEFSAGSELDA
jgi:type IV secretion system protein VirD4